jgi:hypothetical protein
MLSDPVATSASRTASRQRPRLVTRTRQATRTAKAAAPSARYHWEAATSRVPICMGSTSRPAIPPVTVSASTNPRRTNSAKASVAMAR